ncbi:MAG: PE-PPE domain-containing protein [Mycobacterium sp.]
MGAEQYPAGTTPPDIDFVLGGDLNLPNGGLEARFPGLYIPILNWSFNGPEPTDTQFDTVVITRQYDLIADFPLYPLDFIADLNAILGFFYLHLNGFDVSLADNASAPTPIKTEHGDTTYYFFETQDLPLFGPLRTLGVPEPLIDVVGPFFREVVELGYDRSIKPWEPTPARLIPKFNPVTVAGDFVYAIKEGIDNAGALSKPPASLKIPAASTNTDVNEAAQEAELQTNESIGAVESVDSGRTTVSSPGRTDDSTPFNTGHSRQTPVRDAVKNVSSGIKKVVADVSDTIKKAMSVGKHDDTKGAHENEERQSSDSTSSD